jgi:dTDP-4-amino-4,6-dideoxygalactose transaminase
MPSHHDSGSKDTRRGFLKSAGALAAGVWLAGRAGSTPAAAAEAKVETLAMNGGPKAVAASASGASRWPLYGDEEIAAVTELLKSPSYGPVAQFEDAWKEYFGCPFAKAHCNGTNALTSMWFALNLPAGSEVLVPNYSTWFPVVPMRFFDLVPVFVDVNPKTMNICVEDCKRHVTSKTKAIMPVHWFGLPCDMDYIADFAKEHGLVVVEDGSHAHGSKLKGQYMGNWGRIAGISLQMSKPLPSIEGGMAMYKERGDYERATTYGNYDLPGSFPEDSPYRKYQGTALGSKLRMHPVSAILARLQLQKLKEHNTTVVSQVQRLNERLTQLPGLTQQFVRPEMERVFYSANLMFIDEKKAGMSRATAIKALQAEGVECGEFTWSLLHKYPMFGEKEWWRHMPVLPDAVPGCDEANRTAIRLPIFTTEQPELVEQYAKAFEKVWAHREELAKS